jgi:hypothetical protein
VPDRLRFGIGPVPSDVTLGWIANSRTIIAGVRAHRSEVSIRVHDDLADLCETLLDVWEGIASRTDVFQWDMDVTAETIVHLIDQWLEFGALSDDELALIGCTWAPDWTRSFSDALLAGAAAALEELGPYGEALLERLRSGEEPLG